MWFVYILRCADNSLSVGQTNNLQRRLMRHNDGSGARHTAQRGPVHLVHSEEFASRDECVARERQLKGWTRVKKEALIARGSR
jgi:predicted GIY-YIG superfamily endonuclease